MLGKLKGLQLTKKKSFWILLAVQIVLLVYGIVSLFGHDAVYSFEPSQMQVNVGHYDSALDAVVVNGDEGLTGNAVDVNIPYLPKGVYKVALRYESGTSGISYCSVTADHAGLHNFYTNGEHLHEALSATGYNMWLMEDVANLIAHVSYEQGTLKVFGLDIYETNALARMNLFKLVVLCVVLSFCYLFRQMDATYGVTADAKKAFFGCVVITLIASLPHMVDYITSSGDVGYHLMRIEGLKDGILSGQFPVRIAPKWLFDNGYASAVFYPETMLLPAALLRMIGFTVTTSYHIYMIMMNALTVWIAYYCFSRMFSSVNVGLLCSMLQTLSVYRSFRNYSFGSIGETLGFMFLPLIIYGFYRVFTEDYKSKEYKWCFIPLAIGYAGIIQTHMLTCEMVAGFTILLCIILWKKVFTKEIFWALAKTVISAALLSLWYIVPFLDYMMTGDLTIQHVSGRLIQDRGILPAHIFLGFQIHGGNFYFDETGMVNSMPMGIGFGLLVVLLVWLYLLLMKGKKLVTEEGLTAGQYMAGVIAVCFSVVAMILSTSLFPWDRIHGMNKLFEVLVSSLQFPYRFLMIATAMLVCVAGAVGRYAECQEEKLYKVGFYGLITVFTVTTGVYLLTDVLYKGSFMKVYNAAGMGYGYISGAEYLPYGTDQALLGYGLPEGSENVVIEGYDKGALSWEVNCYNQSAEDGYVELPLLYYKGYRAVDEDTGEKLFVYDGENHMVSVEVPSAYTGIISVEFVSPWYWRVAEIINVLAVIGTVVLYKRDKKKLCLENRGK